MTARPSATNVTGMRVVTVALAVLFASGCVGMDDEPARAPTRAEIDGAIVQCVQLPQPGEGGDSFAPLFAASEATQPPPERPRSISLGYVGDEPLTGGVMRATPMPQPGAYGEGQNWQHYVNQPAWPAGVQPLDARPDGVNQGHYAAPQGYVMVPATTPCPGCASGAYY